MKLYYMASGLENAPQVSELHKVLAQGGWAPTYDWTVHGTRGVQGRGNLLLQSTAIEEAEGVRKAHVVVAVLPGGRGTHVELGIALALGRPVIIYSADPEKDFNNDNPDGYACAFYRHPAVVAHISDLTQLQPTMDKVWKKYYEVVLAK